MKLKNFGYDAKGRKALFRNLIQELVMHERITISLARAKYLRPLAEWVIHKGKLGGEKANYHLNRVFYSKDPVMKVVNELAPRFRDIQSGFVRITPKGKRRLDKCQLAEIEFIGNHLEIYEKNDIAKKKEASNTPDFWSWEQKILEQEKDYYMAKISECQAKLDKLQGTGSQVKPGEELKSFDYAEHLVSKDKSKVVPMTPENLTGSDLKLKKELVHLNKHYQRVTNDLEHHLKDKDSNRYKNLDRRYTFS